MNNDISLEYGGALFMLSKEQDKVDEYYSDLMVVKEVFQENPSYIDLLCSPNLDIKEKIELINQSFGGKVIEEIVSFLSLVIENKRIKDIMIFIDSFVDLYNMSKRKLVAKVKTAAPLTDDQKTRLIEKLSKKSGCTVTLDIEIDKSIIGGLVIYMNGTVIDGSIKKQLSEMKRVLTDESKT